MIDFVLTGWWQSCLIPSHISPKIHMSFHSPSGTVSTLPPFCSQKNIAVYLVGTGVGVSHWCCVKMRKGAPWLNLTLLCDLCGISASGRGGVGKRAREKMGIGWIKGPFKPKKKKKAHVETETDKVTQSRVALTESESLVFTVFTFLLHCFLPLSTLFFLSSDFPILLYLSSL